MGSLWPNGKSALTVTGRPGFESRLLSLFRVIAIEFHHLKLKPKSYSNLTNVTGSVMKTRNEKHGEGDGATRTKLKWKNKPMEGNRFTVIFNLCQLQKKRRKKTFLAPIFWLNCATILDCLGPW